MDPRPAIIAVGKADLYLANRPLYKLQISFDICMKRFVGTKKQSRILSVVYPKTREADWDEDTSWENVNMFIKSYQSINTQIHYYFQSRGWNMNGVEKNIMSFLQYNVYISRYEFARSIIDGTLNHGE